MTRTLDRRDLLTWLLTKNEVSLPEVANHFDVAPATAQHHLAILVEANIVQLKPGKGHKGYGAKYAVDQSRLTDIRTLLVAILTLTLFSIGGSYFYIGASTKACYFLFSSSLIGIAYVWIHYFSIYSTRVDRLIKDLNSG